MKKGLLTTLLAAAVTASGIQAGYANAPVISPLPDVQIGDAEDNTGMTDNNYFVYTNAFSLNTYASDDLLTAGQLLWSFSEAGLVSGPDDNTQWFTVNNKGPLTVGNANVGAAYAGPAKDPRLVPNNNPSGGSKRINEPQNYFDPNYASFRDIVLSPGTGPLTTSFNPTPAQKALHAQGKYVHFFLSDGVNVTSDVIIVKSVDNATDQKSTGFTRLRDNQFTTSAGWFQINPTKLAGYDPDGSGPQPALPNDLQRTDFDPGTGSLRAYVGTGVGTASTARYLREKFRIIGWKEIARDDAFALIDGGVPPATAQSMAANSTEMKYSEVGANNWVRAKFHIFATGQTGPNKNQIPSLRVRITGQGYAWGTFQEVLHHSSGSPSDTVSRDLAPSTNPASATIYRVDVDPPEIPSYTINGGSTTQGLSRTFETYSQQQEPQENGYLALTESSIGVYPIPVGGTVIKTYGSTEFVTMNSNNGTQQAGGTERIGQIHTYDADNLALESITYNGGAHPSGLFAQNPPNTIVFTSDPSGISASTVGVDTLGVKFAIAAVDWPQGTAADFVPVGTATHPNYALRARVEPGKQYKVTFTATATVAATQNAQLRFRASNIDFAYNPRLEVGGSQGGGVLAHEYLPGVGTKWAPGQYNLLFVTPFSVNGPNPATIAAEPGPGVSLPSYRDIHPGFDILDEYANPQISKGHVKVSGITITTYPMVAD